MNSINTANLTELLSIILITLFILIIFIKPVFYIMRIFLRGIFYSFLMFVINIVTGSFGFTLGVNLVTALLCGLTGFYGVLITCVTSLLY